MTTYAGRVIGGAVLGVSYAPRHTLVVHTPGAALGRDPVLHVGYAPPTPPVVAAPVDGRTLRWRAADGDWYSRIWVVLGPDMPFIPLIQGNFEQGPEVTQGSSATPAQVRAVKAQIIKWKAPHAYPISVILDFALADDALGFDRVPLQGPRLIQGTFCLPSSPAFYCTWQMVSCIQGPSLGMPFVQGGYNLN